MVPLICGVCGCNYEKYIGHLNRANKLGVPVYCSMACAGIARRANKTTEQKKAEKATYDAGYRYYHKEGIKERKSAAFKIDYAANPEKYKKERQRKRIYHSQYINTPEYKEWKRIYDEKYRAKKEYGEFSEAFLILQKLEAELDTRLIKLENGITSNKSAQKRKRKWQQKLKQP